MIDFDDPLLKLRYKLNRWNENEKLLQKFRDYRISTLNDQKITFHDALQYKFRQAVFGAYLDVFNSSQSQDMVFNLNKFEITKWNIKKMTKAEKEKYHKQNEFLEDSFEVLRHLVNVKDIINWDNVLSQFRIFRMLDLHITTTSIILNKFTNLQVLSLSGNNLKLIKGSHLPRDLRFLELYDNFITNLQDFAKGAPQKLLHLGLGRNCLTDNSSFHLLAESGNFKYLHTLDLSDNEIYNPETAIEFKDLKSLECLQLVGNPCYLKSCYAHAVLLNLPQILYLDNIEILPGDRLYQKMYYSSDTTFFVHCFRIMGLKRIPTEKNSNILQTVHVEIDMPLLQENVSVSKSEGKKKTDDLRKSTGLGKKKKIPKKKKQTSVFENPNEYDVIAEKNNFSIKTEKKVCENFMEFRPVYLQIPEEKLLLLRDTFKSVVTVRVVYLNCTTLAEYKKITQKNSSVLKNKKKKKNEPIPTLDDTTDDNAEVILKKITLCTFTCHLADLNWGDPSMDFYWADHSTIGNTAMNVRGCLKLICYKRSDLSTVTRKSVQNFGTPRKSRLNTFRNSVIQMPLQPIPDIFTCQIGFGVIRDTQVD